MLERNKNNRLVFSIPQNYMIPINDSIDGGSVTFQNIYAEVEVVADTFYWSFRRWLKSMGVPVMQYCIEANLPEIICGEFPDQTLLSSVTTFLENKDSSVPSVEPAYVAQLEVELP